VEPEGREDDARPGARSRSRPPVRASAGDGVVLAGAAGLITGNAGRSRERALPARRGAASQSLAKTRRGRFPEMKRMRVGASAS